MKTTKSLGQVVMLMVALFASPFLMAQTAYTVNPTADLRVSGTSTIHDWEMTSKSASGKASLVATENTVTDIKSLVVEMEAETLKSGKKAMDNNTYKALKTSSHKKIKFELISAAKAANGSWNLTGTFNIAGAAKKVTINAKVTSKDNVHTIKGSYSFKLTEYNITPPTAVMGTIKTGDEVKITFDIKLN
jgi:polyisoprenoid-binding protein YceI